jgi:hypothetical protein
LCSSFAIGENDFVELPSSFLRIKIKYVPIKMIIKWEYLLYTRQSKVPAHSIFKMWTLTWDSFGYHQANPQISCVTFIFYFDSAMEWYVWCLKDRRVYEKKLSNYNFQEWQRWVKKLKCWWIEKTKPK